MRITAETEPTASDHSRFFSGFSEKAEILAQRGHYLEIVVPRGKTLDRLRGSDLEEGLIVCRGDVKKVDAPGGGTYYVDGNVESLEGNFQGGIVYVNGNLGLLMDTDKTILIVTGSVGNYRQSYRSVGGVSLPITHSPFLFSPNPIRGLMRVNGKEIQIEPGMVVEESRLTGWKPEETIARTLELCRERISLENHRRMSKAGRISTAKEIAEFYDRDYQGFTNGYSSGYYAAPSYGYED